MGLAFRTAAVVLVLALSAGTAPAMDSSSDSMSSFSSRPSVNDLYRKAQKSIEAKRYREAIPDLEAIIKERSNHADALNLLGYSHRKLSEYDVSVRYYMRALTADPKHRGANEYLGEAYLEQNNLPEAEARLTRLNELCGMDCKEYKALAESVANYKAGKRPPQSSRASW
jgi:tetratricopeptide (TPR) repeat protein